MGYGVVPYSLCSPAIIPRNSILPLGFMGAIVELERSPVNHGVGSVRGGAVNLEQFKTDANGWLICRRRLMECFLNHYRQVCI